MVSGYARSAYSSLCNSYGFRYDGGSYSIIDGGRDMYDTGNQVSQNCVVYIAQLAGYIT